MRQAQRITTGRTHLQLSNPMVEISLIEIQRVAPVCKREHQLSLSRERLLPVSRDSSYMGIGTDHYKGITRR